MENSDFDSNKVMDCMFDPVTSELLAEMENETKHCTSLAEKFEITQEEIKEKLSYLIKYDFVRQSGSADDITFSVNSDKLAQIMESNHDYSNVEEGLTKIDSFLN